MARQQHAGQKGNPSGRSAFRTEGLPYIHVPSGRHHMRRRRPLSPTASDRGTSQPAQQGQPSGSQRLAPRAAKRPILPCETYGFASPNGLYWRPERPVCQQRANSRGSHRGKGGRKTAQLHGVTFRASGGQPASTATARRKDCPAATRSPRAGGAADGAQPRLAPWPASLALCGWPNGMRKPGAGRLSLKSCFSCRALSMPLNFL